MPAVDDSSANPHALLRSIDRSAGERDSESPADDRSLFA